MLGKRLPAACIAAFLLCAATSECQVGSVPVQQSGVTYVNGQLRIDVTDATLAEVLAKVAAVTGVKIELPEPSDPERMSSLKLGPGAPRDVLASLLRDSHLNYLIQSSDSEPARLLSVLVMPEGKKSSPETAPPASPFRGRNPRTQPAQPKPDDESSSSVASMAASDNTVASDNPPERAPQDTDPGQLPARAPVQQMQSADSRPGTMNPPPVLTRDTITQQLQQMYQQRVQITQQEHQTGQLVSSSEGH